MSLKPTTNIILFLALLLPLLTGSVSAQISDSTNFSADGQVVGGGGGLSTSTNFQIISNIPFVSSPEASSANFQVLPSGFSGLASPDATDSTGSGDGPEIVGSGSFNPPNLIDVIRQNVFEIVEALNQITQQEESQPGPEDGSLIDEDKKAAERGSEEAKFPIFGENEPLSLIYWYTKYISVRLLPWLLLLAVIFFLIKRVKR